VSSDRNLAVHLFFLSRFSMPIEGSILHQDQAWLSRRLELLRAFTLPSLASQTDMEFGWLLAVSRETPQTYRMQLRRIVSPLGRVIFAEDEESLNKAFRHHSRSLNGSVITTRLDTDDAVSRTFVQCIKEKSVPNMALNVCKGTILNTVSGHIIVRSMPSNPFISFCSSDASQSVLSFGGHSQVHTMIPTVDVVTKDPMWMQIIHGGNLKNRSSWFGHPYSRSKMRQYFSVNYDFRFPRIPLELLQWMLYGFSQVIRKVPLVR